MDIKEQISNIVDQIKENDSLKELFDSNPIEAIEKVLNIDLPDEALEKIVDGVKAKISLDKLSSVANAFKNLF